MFFSNLSKKWRDNIIVFILYLQRIEKLIANDLSIDYLFQKFKKIEKYIDKNLGDSNSNKNNDIDKYYFPANSKK